MKGLDALLGEINKKKEQLEKIGSGNSSKRYFKRDELEKSLENKSLSVNPSSEEKIVKKPKTIESKGPEKTSAAPSSEASVPQNIDNVEVIKRLRIRGEPSRLFGETDLQRVNRLRILELMEPEAKGQRNEFHAAFEEAERDLVESLFSSNSKTGSENIEMEETPIVQNIFTTMSEKEAISIATNLGKDLDKDLPLVASYLRYLLGLCKEELDNRPKEEKLTAQGKNASATYRQTLSYTSPFFDLLDKGLLDKSIVVFVVEIVKQLILREYVKANDAYLRMAIGNAPWPIGVTMVGIHARTGRERIFSNNIGHVLNDEVQRKYIQGLKRLMTFAQRKFPADPSKCVEYTK
eukprot:Sdes_comp9015_c0_seq1m436